MDETLLSIVLLGGAAADASARQRADVTIVPKLRRAGTLAFEQLDRRREVGREAGHEAVASGILDVLDGRRG